MAERLVFMNGVSPDRSEDVVSSAPDPSEPPTCAACGGVIDPTDLVCTHCGIALVAG